MRIPGPLSRVLFDALPGRTELVPFAGYEGADRHCEPMARTLLEQRMPDRLDEVLEAFPRHRVRQSARDR